MLLLLLWANEACTHLGFPAGVLLYLYFGSNGLRLPGWQGKSGMRNLLGWIGLLGMRRGGRDAPRNAVSSVDIITGTNDNTRASMAPHGPFKGT